MNRKRLWMTLVGVACLVLAAVPALLFRGMTLRQTDQQAAAFWRADSEVRFAQVSCFLDGDAGFQVNDVMRVRQSVSDALASQTDAAWTAGYSAQTTVSVVKEKTTVSARAICTGGDFFLFHPLELVSGCYYNEEEVNKDSVLLDMNLAWKLYGGYDLQGMSLTVNGLPVTIAGVVRAPAASPEREAYGETPTIWLSLGLMDKLGQTPNLTCYEAVLPNPVKSFAQSTLKTALSLPESSLELLENTGRFGFLTSLKNVWNPAARTMRTSRVIYPYWENAARLVESRSTLYAVLTAVLLLYPVIYILYLVISLLVKTDRRVRGWIHRKRSFR